MIYIVIIALELAVVHWRGGKISRLGFVKFRWMFLLPIAFGFQLLAIYVLNKRPNDLHPESAYLFGWFLLAVFLMRNIRLPRIQLLTIGALVNLAAIAANNGTMPMSKWAHKYAGIALRPSYWYNSMVLAHPRLLFIGDSMALPKSFGPFANVFSIGDLLIFVGFGLFLWRIAFDDSLQLVIEFDKTDDDTAAA